jgi:hypothetical protein
MITLFLLILALVALVAAGVLSVPLYLLACDYVAENPLVLFKAFGLYLVAHCLYWYSPFW